MNFIRENAGTIIVGIAVAAALAFTVIRLIRNVRKKKNGCGCGCSNCG
jgi:uncharacterized membrane protein YccC